MSTRTETIRYQFDAISNLPTVAEQLAQIIALTSQQGSVVAQQGSLIRVEIARQTAAIQEQLTVSKEIARQATLERKAQLEIQTAQLKASEAQMTAYVQAQERERVVMANAIAREGLANQKALLDQELAALKAAHAKEVAEIKAAEEQKVAIIKSELKARLAAQEAASREALIQMKGDQERETAIARAEANQRTAIIKGEINQQTLAMKQGMLEQRLEMGKHGDSLNSIVGTLRDMRTIIGASFSLYEIVQFGQSIVEAKSKLDIFRSGLTQMIGDKREVNTLYADIVKMATQTPFEVEQLFQTTFMLKGMGVATQELIPTLEALGNMAAVAGQDKLPFIAKAFTDVMNKGKLMKQEINQFAENGIPLYDLLAESMGKTRKEVIGMAEDHTIMFADVKKAIMDASQEGGRYYNLMKLQAETLGGQVRNLADKFFLAKARVGDFYEDGLKKTIKGLGDFLEYVAGSNVAIARTEAVLKTVTAAFVTWRLAVSSASIATTALNAATAASALVSGTYNLVMVTLAGSTQNFTRAQLAAAVAARGTWAALASNPLGIVITLVGTAVTAWQAYNAVTADTARVVSDQEVQIQKEQSTLQGLVQAVFNAGDAQDKRKKAMELLIAKYPEYFAGLDAERTSNADLTRILGTVNRSYEERIALAREAYKVDQLQGQQKTYLQREMDLLKELPKELQEVAKGSVSNLLKEMAGDPDIKKLADNSRSLWKGVFSGSLSDEAKEISQGLLTIRGEFAKAEKNVSDITQAGKVASITAEKDRHATVMAQLKAAHESTKTEMALHNKNMAKLQDDADTVELTQLKGKAEKMKQIALLTQTQIKALLTGISADTLKEELDAVDARVKAEIEAVNKVTVSRKIGEDQRVAMAQEAQVKIKAIYEKGEAEKMRIEEKYRIVFSDRIQEEIDAIQTKGGMEMKGIRELSTAYQEGQTTYGNIVRQKVKMSKEAEAQIQSYNKETAQIEEETAKVQIRSRKEIISLGLDILGQQSGLIGEMSKSIKAILNNFDVISGQAKQAAQEGLDTANRNLAFIRSAYDEGTAEGAKKIAYATQQVAENENKVAKATAASNSAALGLVGVLVQLGAELNKRLNEMYTDFWQGIADAYAKTQEVVREFYDSVETMQRDSMEEQLAMTEGNYEKQLAIINNYYAKIRQTASNRDYFDNMLAEQKEYAEALVEVGRSNGFNYLKNKEALAEKEKEMELNKFLRSQELIIRDAELRKEQAKKVLDITLQYIDDELNKFKDAKEQEMDILRKNADESIEFARKNYEGDLSVLTTAYNARKDLYQKDVDAVRTAYDTTVAAMRDAQTADRAQIQATYDLKQQLLDQSVADEIEKIGIVDRARNEVLERYRVSEVEKLTATKNRILATLTDEGEKQRVTEEYDRRIGQVHADVEQGKLDKTKGINLATTQLREEARNTATKLKEEEKTAIQKLDDDYQVKFKKLADERDAKLAELKTQQEARDLEYKTGKEKLETTLKATITKIEEDLGKEIQKLKDQLVAAENKAQADRTTANNRYRDAAIAADRAIFEANKQMLVAQLQAEIAILKSKRSWTGIGNGKINSAINDINQAIAEINGTSYNDVVQTSFGPGVPVRADGSDAGTPVYGAFDKAGNKMEITYNESGKTITAYGADGKPFTVAYANGFVPATGERLFHGTEFVRGLGQPDGVDTVPAWLTKGERVLSTEQNRRLMGLSNEELVRRIEAFSNLTAHLPRPGLLAPEVLAGLPNGQSTDLSGLNENLMNLTKRFDALMDKQQVAVNIDQNGFRITGQSQQAQTEYYQNLFHR